MNMVGTGPRWIFFQQHCSPRGRLLWGLFGGPAVLPLNCSLIFPISPPAYGATEGGTTYTSFTDEE